MTDSERLDNIEKKLDAILVSMSTIEKYSAEVVKQVKPVMDKLHSNPLLKNFIR